MNQCTQCGNKSYSTIVIFTETTFGHGDSTHKCYVKCVLCSNRSKEETGWDWFSEKSFRKAQDNWNEENKPEDNE